MDKTLSWRATRLQPDLAAAWDSLTADGGGTIFQQRFWNESWANNFLSAESPLTVHQLTRGNELIGILPLLSRGRFVRRLNVPRNSHTPMVDLPFRGGESAFFGAVLDHLATSADVVRFSGLPMEGAPYRALVQEIEKRGLAVHHENPTRQSLVDLTGGWPAFREKLSKELVSNTERKERRLKEVGALELREVCDDPNLDGILKECFDLEAASWKGAEGTAMSSQASTLGFYTDLAHAAAKRRALALYTLRVGGRLVAFDYCVKWNGWIHLLKLGFDASLSKYSPGGVIRYAMVRKEVEEARCHTYDLGLEMDWKTRWTSNAASLCCFDVYFGHPRARAAHLFGPKFKESCKRITWLRRIVNSAREAREASLQAKRDEVKKQIRNQDEKTVSANKSGAAEQTSSTDILSHK